MWNIGFLPVSELISLHFYVFLSTFPICMAAEVIPQANWVLAGSPQNPEYLDYYLNSFIWGLTLIPVDCLPKNSSWRYIFI